MTFATELAADRREEGRTEYDEWRPVEPNLVDEVVGRMDQRRHTETTLEGPNWWFALIGGGAGAYVVSIENQMTGVRYQLIDPLQSDDKSVDVVTGGQLGHFAARLVVGPDTAVQAARHFAETGEPDPALEWIEEQSD